VHGPSHWVPSNAVGIDDRIHFAWFLVRSCHPLLYSVKEWSTIIPQEHTTMSSTETLADLIELAIQLENATEALYRGLGAKFAHHPELEKFWQRYAAEELGHARWLERLRRDSSAEQLSAPADPMMLKMAQKMLQFSVDSALAKIKNLDEAYELAVDVENSETNAIFTFLITNYYADKDTVAFLRNQIKDHINNLTDELPAPFKDRALRQATPASG
jgi:rubrerythrin